jgi:hypothetical protein
MQNADDYTALVLLAMQGLALGIGFLILGWMFAVHRRRRRMEQSDYSPALNFFPFNLHSTHRPGCWLAVRSVSTEAVKDALALNRAAPCSWEEGLAGGHEFFISQRVHGWVIVTGLGLPNPSDDVDATFLFLTGLSRKLGHVQYFYASRLMRHHAWARLDEGCVTRAYAWTGETVWNQGVETLPEHEIGMRVFAYGDQSATILDAETNFGKVPQLAARWSLDPAEVKINSARQATGIAGESAFI